MIGWRARWWFLAASLLVAAPARAREDLSGSWREEYEEDIRSVEQWDRRCGDAPQSPGRRQRGLIFTVEDRGVELRFSSPQQRFSTSDCQSSHPEIRERETTIKEGLFLKNCSTADTTTDYESGLYSFRVTSPTSIEYRETTRYSRSTTEGALCVHTRRVQRRYTRLPPVDGGSSLDGGPAATPPPEEPAADPADAGSAPFAAPVDAGTPPESEDACHPPGPIRELRALPWQAQVLVGETFCPRLEGRDAAGCAVVARPDLQPAEPLPGVRWTPEGCLRISERAPGGTRTIEIRSQGLRTEMRLVILRRLEATARPVPEEPPPVEPAPAPPAAETAPLPPVRITAPPAPPASPTPPAPPEAPATPSATPGPADSVSVPWLAAAGSAAVLLCLGLWLGLRRRSQRRSPPAAAAAVPTPTQEPRQDALPTLQVLPRAGGALGPASGGIFCTECGRALPAGARFCPFDRTPAPPAESTPRDEPVCPTCGRALPAGARFCPFDRTPLGKDPAP